MDYLDIGNGHKLATPAGRAFLAMDAAIFAELGLHLPVNVSTRSLTRQKQLYAKWVAAGKPAANPVAVPGTSEHDENNAVAVDINQSSDARILPWLCKNGPTFGFFATAKNEKWHWAHYLGKPPTSRYIRHVNNLKAWGHG
jgi:LAS superfamily LD-carboxypeptidase LdcB